MQKFTGYLTLGTETLQRQTLSLRIGKAMVLKRRLVGTEVYRHGKLIVYLLRTAWQTNFLPITNCLIRLKIRIFFNTEASIRTPYLLFAIK